MNAPLDPVSRGTLEPEPISIRYEFVDALVPYARNSRTHSEEQVEQIARSIEEFGFTNPVLVDGEGTIIAGHGRVMAAKLIGLARVPTIALGHLSEAQRRAYVIADNRIALNAGWDEEMLRSELSALIDSDAAELLDLVGFSNDELSALLEDPLSEGRDYSGKYASRIQAPAYVVKGEEPEVETLFDASKTLALLERIDAADLPDDVARFLRLAAERHTVFDFRRIAEYYAAAPEPVQALMEESALVIVDFESAIANGFVVLSEALQAQAGADADAIEATEGWEDDPDADA